MDMSFAIASWACLTGATATPVDASSGTVTCFRSPHGQFYLKRKASIALVWREVQVLTTLAAACLPVTLPLRTHVQLP
jgi:hypothetical protein